MFNPIHCFISFLHKRFYFTTIKGIAANADAYFNRDDGTSDGEMIVLFKGIRALLKLISP